MVQQCDVSVDNVSPSTSLNESASDMTWSPKIYMADMYSHTLHLNCRDGVDVRSTLDNLANAALLAAEVEQEELEAAAAAPPPSRAGKTSVRTVARRPNKKPRSGSGTSSPGTSPEGHAVHAGPADDRPLSASASHSKLDSIDLETAQGKEKVAAAGAAASIVPEATAEFDTDAVMHTSQDQLGTGAQGSQTGTSMMVLQAQGVPVDAVSVTDIYDPIAAAIKNATEAITTDGAMQAAMPDLGIELEDIGVSEPVVSDPTPPPSASEGGVAAYLDPVPPQQLPEQLPLQVAQMPNESTPDHLTLQGHSGTVTYPVTSDGTVTITTSHPAASAPGATMMVQQPEGLLIVRDPSTGKEICLGKLLKNSLQTSGLLQAAGFVEPCST